MRMRRERNLAPSSDSMGPHPQRHRLTGRLAVELFEDALHMLTDSAFRNVQLLGDLPIQQTVRAQEMICSSRTVSCGEVSSSRLMRRLAKLGFESFHHTAAAEPLDGLGQLIGVLFADEPLRSGLHQLVAVASDGEAGDAEDWQMPVHQTDTTACSWPLQSFHGHVENKQTEIVAGFLVTVRLLPLPDVPSTPRRRWVPWLR